MNKELDKLCYMYQKTIEGNAVNMKNIKWLCDERNKVYEAFKQNHEPVLIDDVVAERTTFWAVPYGVLCNSRISNNIYIDLLNLITATDPSHNVLNDEEILQVLDVDEKILTDVLKNLKLNPRKASLKIKDIREAKAAIDTKRIEIKQRKASSSLRKKFERGADSKDLSHINVIDNGNREKITVATVTRDLLGISPARNKKVSNSDLDQGEAVKE